MVQSLTRVDVRSSHTHYYALPLNYGAIPRIEDYYIKS